jgi:FPC/CPF motif-containing protein YcgG
VPARDSRDVPACAGDLHQHTSLVVLFRPDPEPRSVEDYHEQFWALLQYLHDRDTEPWPAGVAKDLDDPWWEFSFRGTPMFVVCNTPAHVRRRSRSGTGVVVTFQPRWVFAGLEAESRRGQAARRTIREHLRQFDGMEPAPELGGYGDPDKREWKQYFLPDENGGELPRCPFHTRREEP